MEGCEFCKGTKVEFLEYVNQNPGTPVFANIGEIGIVTKCFPKIPVYEITMEDGRVLPTVNGSKLKRAEEKTEGEKASCF